MLNHASSRAGQEFPDLQGKRILVVEDDAVVAVEYHFELQRVGAVESLQPSATRALQYLAENQVDAAVVDYRLPDGDCAPVLAQLAERRIPFIVVSGDMFGVREIPESAPVLSKPVRSAELYESLADILTARRAQERRPDEWFS